MNKAKKLVASEDIYEVHHELNGFLLFFAKWMEQNDSKTSKDNNKAEMEQQQVQTHVKNWCLLQQPSSWDHCRFLEYAKNMFKVSDKMTHERALLAFKYQHPARGPACSARNIAGREGAKN
jgi:hypothetical protein